MMSRFVSPTDLLGKGDARYRSIYDAISGGIVVLNRDGSVVDANDAACRILGLTRKQMIGKSEPCFRSSAIREDGSPIPPEHFPCKVALRTGNPVRNVIVGIRFPKSNELRWIMFNSEPVMDHAGSQVEAVVTSFLDVTDLKRTQIEQLRKSSEASALFQTLLGLDLRLTADGTILQRRVENALRESEQWYQTLVDAVDDAISVQGRDGRFIVVNALFAKWLGLEKREILGRTLAELVGLEAASKMLEQDHQLILSRSAVEFEVLFPGRQERICFIRKVPLCNRRGNIAAVVTVARDVSWHKVVEQQMLRAYRLQTAGQVAAQVAHDLKNFLSTLINCPELIKARLPRDHPAVPICDTMLEAAIQVESITDDMLSFGRRVTDDRKSMDLNKVVQQVVGKLNSMPDTHTLQLRLEPSLFPVFGSPRQLARVITNLVTNAREAMLDSGTITIRTSNVYLDKPLNRYDEVEIGEYVLLEVVDDGPGIAPEIQDRVFDAFFTTAQNNRRAGLGLGLTIVHAIVEDHLGYVDLVSEPGKGTTFSVYLPVAREDEDLKIETLPKRAETILVVDDDRIQRQVLAQMLTRLGYAVQVVSSGLEAVDYLARNPVDLVCLDMVMPEGIDGTETYRRITQVRPGQKAVILSGYAESERVEAALQMGVGAFVEKPVTLERLAREIRRELDRGHGATERVSPRH